MERQRLRLCTQDERSLFLMHMEMGKCKESKGSCLICKRIFFDPVGHSVRNDQRDQ
jgi:hypothetical protein